MFRYCHIHTQCVDRVREKKYISSRSSGVRRMTLRREKALHYNISIMMVSVKEEEEEGSVAAVIHGRCHGALVFPSLVSLISYLLCRCRSMTRVCRSKEKKRFSLIYY